MQHVFLKMNPFVISIFFMLFSFDTAWKKVGGASAPPVSTPLLVAVNKLLTEILEEKQLKDELSLWDLNVLCYSSEITVLENLDRIETIQDTSVHRTPRWQMQAEIKISSLRKKLSLIDVVQKCKASNTYTTHQRSIEGKLKNGMDPSRWKYWRTRKVDLKQQLKTECEKLRRRKEIEERKRINYQFKKEYIVN